MSDLVITKLSENATTVTLGWQPPAGAQGYAYVRNADGKRLSSTLDGTTSSVKVARSNLPVTVRALRTLVEGVYPPVAPPPPVDPPPSPLLGTGLPTRISAATGVTMTPSQTLAQIQDACNNARRGTIIDCKGMIVDAQGGTLLLGTPGDPQAITELHNLTVVNGGAGSGVRFGVNGSYWRLRNVWSNKSAASGFKFTDGSHHFELVDCGSQLNAADGLLTSGQAHDWQVWNHQSLSNGLVGNNKDQGYYIGAASGACLLANCYAYNPSGYGLQIQYPQSVGLLVTCMELDGGPNTVRGGVVLSYGSSFARIVGLYAHDTPMPAVHVYNGDGYPDVHDHQVFDSYEERTGGGFETVPGVQNTRVHTGAPGPIDPSMFALVPALDATGKPRGSVPTAGRYA